MLQSTLSALLVSVASRYAELSPADVGIGIGGGRLVIDDVKLRAETFNYPSLPFHVYQGRAGRLRVNVPWSALSSSPVELYLENVHLIAGPKRESKEADDDDVSETTSTPSMRREEDGKSLHRRKKGPWHQTSVGRLAFNVSAEMYGLKVEYRDDSCVGIMSVASVRAFSADRDWNSRFVSLALDPDADTEDTTTAVPMRKLVRLSGVHWVMIPRNENVQEQRVSADGRPQLDLDSFESQAPIVDGIAVTLRVLLCTGKASVEPDVRILTSGLHAEIEIDLEDPKVNLTARQMKWIDHILKQGLGLAGKANKGSAVQSDLSDGFGSPLTKRRPRPLSVSISTEHLNSERDNGTEEAGPGIIYHPGDRSGEQDVSNAQDLRSDAESFESSKGNAAEENNFDDEVVDAEIDKVSEYDEEYASGEEDDYDLSDEDTDTKVPNGGLFSWWQAIVGENGDETIDDAAVALGLSNGVAPNEEPLDIFAEDEDERKDRIYARKAVEAAAKAGGLTLQVRLKTPDMKAWDIVEQLRGEAAHDQEMLGKLRGVEQVLEAAEARVRACEAEMQNLRDRNASLLKELEDLERLTGQAGRNKDAMIRQMEAALGKAERNLQAVLQAQLERSPGTPNAVNTRLVVSNPASPVRQLESEPVPLPMENNVETNGRNSRNSLSQSEGDELIAENEVGEKSQEEEVADGYVVPTNASPTENETFKQEEALSQTEAKISAERDTQKTLVPVPAPPPENLEETVAPISMKEVGLVIPTDEQYLKALSTQKLQEAMSSEGLTLI